MDQKDVNEAIIERANTCCFYEQLGITVDTMGEGKARLQMPFDQRLTQPQGLMHGGAIASLADSAVAIALLSLVGPNTGIATIEMKINYLTPVTTGILYADAYIAWKGTRIVLGEVDVTNDKGDLVAKSIMTYMVMGRRDAAKDDAAGSAGSEAAGRAE